MKIDKELTYDTFRCVLLKSDGVKNRRHRGGDRNSKQFFSYVGNTTNISLSACFVITSFLSLYSLFYFVVFVF